MSMAACLGCGKPIPELIINEGKFNFVCTKCHCETKPQDTLEEAEEALAVLMNDLGHAYSYKKETYRGLRFVITKMKANDYDKSC